jgi:Xaa-Pro aminopeptidase
LVATGRLERVRRRASDASVAALLVTNLSNIRWLTGFSGSAGMLLVTGERAVLTSDGRYRTQAAEQVRSAEVDDVVEVVIGGVVAQREAIAAALGPGQTVGLEADSVSWSDQRRWAEALEHHELVPTQALVETERTVKDTGELARMERAAAIADEALARVVGLLAGAGRGEPVPDGMGGGPLSERRFAAALDNAMRELGSEEPAFETIVASGENSAKPHARPGDRLIMPGDAVVVDFGATFDGYRSDMTRTFSVGGAPTGELARVFDVVLDAQRTGVGAVAPGVVAGRVDEACREVITAAGWGERFEHGTGHGVGLDIHEAPSVGPGSTAILEEGTVATVEPGVYLAGVGGVRIEDTLVVTADGSRPLTNFTKDVAV